MLMAKRTLRGPSLSRWFVGIVVIYLTAVAPGTVLGYPSGAPVNACQSMLPAHGVAPQEGTNGLNIRITANVTEFHPTKGARVLVAITAQTTSDLFRGFLIQARHVGGSEALGRFYESFVLPGGQTYVRCGSARRSAITHSNNIDKMIVTMPWIIRGSVSDIIFVATIVRTEDIFWTNVTSNVLFPTITTTQETWTEPETTYSSHTSPANHPTTSDNYQTTKTDQTHVTRSTVSTYTTDDLTTDATTSTDQTKFATTVQYTKSSTQHPATTADMTTVSTSGLHTGTTSTGSNVDATTDAAVTNSTINTTSSTAWTAPYNKTHPAVTTDSTTISTPDSNLTTSSATTAASNPNVTTSADNWNTSRSDNSTTTDPTNTVWTYTTVINDNITAPFTTTPPNATTLTTNASVTTQSKMTTTAETYVVTVPTTLQTTPSSNTTFASTKEPDTTVNQTEPVTTRNVTGTKETPTTLYTGVVTDIITDIVTINETTTSYSSSVTESRVTTNVTTNEPTNVTDSDSNSKTTDAPATTASHPMVTNTDLQSTSESMKVTKSPPNTPQMSTKETLATAPTTAVTSATTKSSTLGTTAETTTAQSSKFPTTSDTSTTSGTTTRMSTTTGTTTRRSTTSETTPERSTTSATTAKKSTTFETTTKKSTTSRTSTRMSTTTETTTRRSTTSKTTPERSTTLATTIKKSTTSEATTEERSTKLHPSTSTEPSSRRIATNASTTNSPETTIEESRLSIMTTTQEPIKQLADEVLIRFRITSKEFTENLQRPSSQEYRNLAMEVVAVIQNVYRNDPGLENVTVLQFLMGSVIPEVKLTFSSSLNDSAKMSVVQVLYNEAEDGQIGDYAVDSVSSVDQNGVYIEVNDCYLHPCPPYVNCSIDQCTFTCANNPSYCRNGGSCLDLSSVDQSRTFANCTCKENYEGPRCDAVIKQPNESNDNDGLLIIVLACVCAVVVVLFVTLLAGVIVWFRRFRSTKERSIDEDPVEVAKMQFRAEMRGRSISNESQRATEHQYPTTSFSENPEARLPSNFVVIGDVDTSSGSLYYITDSDSGSDYIRPQMFDGGATFPNFSQMNGSFPDLLEGVADYEMDVLQRPAADYEMDVMQGPASTDRQPTDSLRRRSVSFSDMQQVITDDNRIGFENFSFGSGLNANEGSSNFQVRWDFQIGGNESPVEEKPGDGGADRSKKVNDEGGGSGETTA